MEGGQDLTFSAQQRYSSFNGVFSPGKPDSVLSSVKDAVVLRQKNISQNPQRPFGGNDVNGLKTAETQIPVAKRLLLVTNKQRTG